MFSSLSGVMSQIAPAQSQSAKALVTSIDPNSSYMLKMYVVINQRNYNTSLCTKLFQEVVPSMGVCKCFDASQIIRINILTS